MWLDTTIMKELIRAKNAMRELPWELGLMGSRFGTVKI